METSYVPEHFTRLRCLDALVVCIFRLKIYPNYHDQSNITPCRESLFKLKLPITKKQSPSKQIDELILSIHQVQLDRVLISTLLQPLKKETTPCLILKIATVSWNSFFSQNRDRSSLVNRNKTGVIVFENRKFNVNV